MMAIVWSYTTDEDRLAEFATKPGGLHFFHRVPGRSTHQIGFAFLLPAFAGELSSLSQPLCGVSDFSKNQTAI
jgi:hypothetical protein